MSWTIYEHISPSGKIYVGITSQSPKDRWKYGTGYKESTIFHNAILKYGWDNIQHIIIASNLGEGTAKNMEKDLIAFNKAKGISYNITDGGEGALGRVCTDFTKAKIAKAHLGKKLSQETIIKCTAHCYGSTWAESQREKFINTYKKKKEEGYTFKGHPCSELNKQKLRETKLGVPRSLDTIEKLKHNKRCVPVCQYTLDGVFVKEFISIKEAARIIGVDKTCISRCCKGINATCKGYKWSFKNNN